MANVSLKGVYKYYGNSENPSVSDFNLEIKDKEFIVFVGPSGCGKSTTLRMVAGLEKISLGEVSIDGRVANNVEPKDRDIAMVFQNYALYPHMTVFKNIAYSLTLARTAVEVRDESTITALGKDGKKLKGLARVLARTPMEARDSLLNVVLDEKGQPKYLTKKDTKAKTPKEKRDANGDVVLDSEGNPVYIVKKNKDGSVQKDKAGNPVYEMRRFTKEEIKEGLCPDKLDKNGKPIYVMRPYTIDEYAGRPVLDKDGKPVCVAELHTRASLKRVKVPCEELDASGKPVLDENGRPKYKIKKNAKGEDVLDAHGKPVFVTRKYTEAEIEKRIGTPKTDKNGEVVYSLRKFTKPEIEEKVWEAARILDITQYLERKPSELSGGQRQRVAIGRSIVRNPKVFLFDEPLSNLDAKLRNQMRAEIIALRHKINTTFIYVTHDQIEAMTLGDRIVIMRDGFMQQVGTPTQLFDHPANLFVAGFIGTPQMNFFDGVLKVADGKYIVDVNGKRFSLREEISDYLAKQNAAEKEIVLGVRPEHIVMDSKNTQSTLEFLKNSRGVVDFIEADVTVAEMMGSELYVHTSISEGKSAVVRVPTVSLSREDRKNIDNFGKIRFTFAPETMHIFDKETSANLIPLDVDLRE